MPEWIRKRCFYSIKSMKRTLVSCYGLCLLMILILLLMYSDYTTFGYIRVRGKFVYGTEDSKLTLYGCTFVVALMLMMTIYSTFYGLYQAKKGKIPNLPFNSICYNCQSVFNIFEITSMVCTKCGGKLEDLKGFYDRHPEKNTTG
jgi:magnesium-transporting ATPase (P-type)